MAPANALFEIEAGDRESRAAALIALIIGIGDESHPSKRARLVKEVCHRAYAHAARYSEQKFEFINWAIDAYPPEGVMVTNGRDWD